MFLLRRTEKKRALSIISVALFCLASTACQQGTSRNGLLANQNLPSGLGTGTSTSALGGGLVGSNLPSLTGNGIPTSLQQSQATGVGPANLPQNTSNYSYDQLLQQWQAQWTKPVPYDPTVVPEAIQRYIIQLHCYYGAYYGGFTTTPRYALILSLYLDVLARYPEWEQVRQQVAAFPNTPDATVRKAQALGFVNSDGAITETIKRVYKAFLRRDGSDAEVAGWKAQAQADTLESMYAKFVASQEYYQNAAYGGNNNLRTWIASATRDLLGRAANAWEIEYFVYAFSTNGGSREAVALHLARSDEAQMKFLMNAYLFYLNRYPSSSELSQRVNEMRQGIYQKAMMAQILATPDYLQRQPARYGALLDTKYCK